MQISAIGIDLAKKVFQVHGVRCCREAGSQEAAQRSLSFSASCGLLVAEAA